MLSCKPYKKGTDIMKNNRINRNILCLVLSAFMILSVFGTAPAVSAKSKAVIHSFAQSAPSESGYTDIKFAVPSVGSGLDDTSLPSYYDSRAYDLVSTVKNQKETGMCWAFAAASTAETSLAKLNGYPINSVDLSELHLAYYTYNDAYDALGLLKGDSTMPFTSYLTSGGMHYTTVLSLARWTGLIDENKNEKFAFSNADSNFRVTDNRNAYGNNEAIIKDAYYISTKDASEIKKLIMTYGSAVVGFYYDDAYLNKDTAGYCYIATGSGGIKSANHEACIVGWNDNYSKTSFLGTKPQNNGAWLLKNSWGESFGDAGYIWVSYEDTALLNDDACFMTFTSAKQYDYNYQYDGSGNPTSNYSDGTDPVKGGFMGGGYMSNIYTAQHSDYLNAVSFVTYDPNVNYSIEIYTDIKDKADPRSGKKALLSPITGAKKYAGYYTVPLPESISLTKGQKFSVIVRLFKDRITERVILPCDKTESKDWIRYTNEAISNQSFFSTNGNTWSNVSKEAEANFRIKAFTSRFMIGESYDVKVSVRGISLDKNFITLKEGNTTALHAAYTPAFATNRETYWYSSDEKIATVSSGGRVTAIREGIATVYAVAKDGGFTATCTVNVKPYDNNNDPIPTSMTSGDVLSIDEAVTLQDGEAVTVVGQVVHSFASASGGEKCYVIIEDIIDNKVCGLLLYDEQFSYDYKDGDIVKVTGKITTYKGSKEIYEITNVTKLGDAEPIPAQEVTISRLRAKADEFLNEFVVLSNVTLTDYAADGYTLVTDSTGTINIYNAEHFPDGISEGDKIDLFCVFSIYGNTYQLRTGDSSCYVKYKDDAFIKDSDTDTVKICYYGDVNLDGYVKMDDVTELQKYIALLEDLDETALAAADVNLDYEVDMVDVTDMQKYIAKLMDSFTAGEYFEIESDSESAEELKAALGALIAEIEKFKDSYYNNDDGYYTEESFEAFTLAYSTAISVYNDPEALIDELEYAYNNLDEAILGLTINGQE